MAHFRPLNAILLASLLCGGLAACSTASQEPADRDAQACRMIDAPTGSNIKRRSDCVPTSPEQAQSARDAAKSLVDDVNNMQPVRR